MNGTNRLGHRMVWALGAAALACVAGGADGAGAPQPRQEAEDRWWEQYQDGPGRDERGDWRAENRMGPTHRRAAGEAIYLEQEIDGREVVVRLRHGRVAARLDGRGVPPEQIEIRGDRVRVLDETGETAAVFRIPQEAMRQARMQRAWRGADQPGPDRPQRERARERLHAFPGEEMLRFSMEEPLLEGLALLLREQMIAAGQPPVAVGILMAPAEDDDLAGADRYTSGVRIERTLEGLPAAEAGLREGDVIVAVDDQPNATADTIRRILMNKNPGETVKFTILRDGDERQVEVTLEAFDAEELNWDFVAPRGEAMGPQGERRQARDRQDRPSAPPRRTDRPTPPARPVLGVSVSEAPREAFEDVEEYDAGVVVQQLREGLPAAEAGLREGDIIVEFDGQKITSPTALQELVSDARPGRSVAITILRDGEVQRINVPLGTSD